MTRAFYSVVQYCPDRSRAEAVNLGLVLLSLDPHAIRARMSSKQGRVRKLFSLSRSELKNLRVASRGMQLRIESDPDGFRSEEDLAAFAASRANDLRLTEPRLAKIDDFDADFERLFSRLVESGATESLAEELPAEVLPPKLGEVFYRLQASNRIWKPGTVVVPVFGQKLDVPYAFRNGVVNLVKPHVFPASKRAEGQAALLAVNGDLIRKHSPAGDKQKLIIISTQETSAQAKEIDDHVAPLFEEYRVRLVRPCEADDFAREVERDAH